MEQQQHVLCIIWFAGVILFLYHSFVLFMNIVLKNKDGMLERSKLAIKQFIISMSYLCFEFAQRRLIESYKCLSDTSIVYFLNGKKMCKLLWPIFSSPELKAHNVSL